MGPRRPVSTFLALLSCSLLACDRSQGTPPAAVSAPAASPISTPLTASPAAHPTESAAPTASTAASETAPPLIANPALVTARPYKLRVPEGIDSTKTSPLVLFLHGYGANSGVFESALGIGNIARARRFIYALPDGTPDSHHMKFWNASDACCDFDGTNTDDVAYLTAVIADAMGRQNVDPKRVYVVGFSNGGFMAHRLACELSGTLAGIASIAGGTWKDPAKCSATHPVTVLQVHGDADPVVRYGGGQVLDKMHMQPHPAAKETVGAWASRDQCGSSLISGASLDLEDKYEGAETIKARHEGCTAGTAVELWTVRGGNHFVSQKPRAIEAVVAFLLDHPKH